MVQVKLTTISFQFVIIIFLISKILVGHLIISLIDWWMWRNECGGRNRIGSLETVQILIETKISHETYNFLWLLQQMNMNNGYALGLQYCAVCIEYVAAAVRTQLVMEIGIDSIELTN